MTPPPPSSTLFPYTTLFRSSSSRPAAARTLARSPREVRNDAGSLVPTRVSVRMTSTATSPADPGGRSEEHTSELQSRRDLVCRLLLEKKKKKLVNTQSNCTT